MKIPRTDPPSRCAPSSLALCPSSGSCSPYFLHACAGPRCRNEVLWGSFIFTLDFLGGGGWCGFVL